MSNKNIKVTFDVTPSWWIANNGNSSIGAGVARGGRLITTLCAAMPIAEASMSREMVKVVVYAPGDVTVGSLKGIEENLLKVAESVE